MPEKIQDCSPERRARLVKYLCLSGLLTGLALEACFAWQVGFEIRATASLSSVLMALAGAVLTAAGLCHFSPGNPWLAFWLFLGLTLFIPFYGAWGSVLIALYQRLSTGWDLVVQYTDYVHSEKGKQDEDQEFFATGSVDQMVHQELSVQPYIDIVRGPDRLLKKALLSKITSEWTPNAVTLLKQALKDPDYEIRSHASTALTAIENHFNQGILRLQESIAREPDQTSLKLKLVQSYLDYASSGLLDQSSAEHYVHMAEEVLKGVQEENDEEARLYLLGLRGQAARLSGDAGAEKQIYQEILQSHPEHQGTLGHLCALYLREKNFSKLRRTCELLQRTATTDHSVLEAARMWSGTRPSHPAGVQA